MEEDNLSRTQRGSVGNPALCAYNLPQRSQEKDWKCIDVPKWGWIYFFVYAEVRSNQGCQPFLPKWIVKRGGRCVRWEANSNILLRGGWLGSRRLHAGGLMRPSTEEVLSANKGDFSFRRRNEFEWLRSRTSELAMKKTLENCHDFL